MNIRSISISDYTYTLPDNKIARYPLQERDASRLLIYEKGKITEDTYRNIATYLPHRSLLLLNDTRVIPARLLFQKESGGIIELFCLEPLDIYGGIGNGMQQQQTVQWKCLIGGASKWKTGQVLQKKIALQGYTVLLEARYLGKQHDYFAIEFIWTPAQLSFAAVLQEAGAIPVPPYLKRQADATDLERYQTVYARQDGSVAAPTAGLHFTPGIFQRLAHKNIQHAFLTLHVGAGTFKPVKAAVLQEHEMHAEFIEVDTVVIEQLRRCIDLIYAVGTTAARTLESLYWMGVKTMLQPLLLPEQLGLTQWEVYDNLQVKSVPPEKALDSLLLWLQQNQLNRLISKTQLLIAPGYRFKIIQGLVTNFHQPQSTLLLLIAALTGNDWLKIYDYALSHNFRFLSYGDGCLLKCNNDGI